MSYFDNIRTFVRVYELGSMSAAARDQRVSPAVASARITQLEGHLGVRLFQRTTRSLSATEQGRIFYDGACKILASVAEAEAGIEDVTENPRGTLHVAAPLGVGRRLIAPHVPAFSETYPLVDVRLRLSDRKLDLTAEGLDVAFFLGRPQDSTLRIRKVADCERVLCASPAYVAAHGHPRSGAEIDRGQHNCLNLRFPGATEFQWQLQGPEGAVKYDVRGRFESDDGDVLTDWALAGAGIAMKPIFEIAEHLQSGALVRVVEDTPPLPVQMACLYTHRRHQDPKTRLFMDFMIARMEDALKV
ncbi:LysR family transcriptional regulator [Sulfitobacter sp. KE34]|uniref:LysR family transcriptional regulator n=1 Tax=Sulfitobacter faviae TaxID=1775881 RepID=A0AAX3LKJ8_9RHOB|nr:MULTISPECIES: LysR family transcriptional regulator [Sulfitobacter]MDF3349469.1 LysR family transcriptional regulator [Sulfitobacter sp. KE12]MDF3353140.1 LysR family transcriptional regulator [Sulfitobacter sp. KE27]MDF3356787.1 LysR family transcriptional regulator [Sulfitobacter sp. KE33]MDF3359622.1 LysR family transcriptional regulator [Sulfitobacter sp. Ks41]MDF3364211.1 LysR family transcriptional regulator [Sulfitobacter sp. Ks34]